MLTMTISDVEFFAVHTMTCRNAECDWTLTLWWRIFRVSQANDVYTWRRRTGAWRRDNKSRLQQQERHGEDRDAMKTNKTAWRVSRWESKTLRYWYDVTGHFKYNTSRKRLTGPAGARKLIGCHFINSANQKQTFKDKKESPVYV